MDKESDCGCCTYIIFENDDDMDILDDCFEESSNLSLKEKSMLYYISGYVAQKEDLYGPDTPDEIHLLESEFTVELSRGKLRIPPTELYELSQYCYAFFKARSSKCCTKIFLEAFEIIHNFTLFDLPDSDRINRRFLNCFFKAFVKDGNEKIQLEKRAVKDQRDTKRRRISSDA